MSGNIQQVPGQKQQALFIEKLPICWQSSKETLQKPKRRMYSTRSDTVQKVNKNEAYADDGLLTWMWNFIHSEEPLRSFVGVRAVFQVEPRL